MGRLDGKVALVTGGASGYGVGIVDKFINEGAKLVILDIKKPNRTDEDSNQWIYLSMDVSKEEEWVKALKFALDKFGQVDIVVNNAGVLNVSGPSTDCSNETFDWLISVNVKALFHSSKIIIPYMVERGKGGVFLSTGSTAGVRARPNLVWYQTTKGALNLASKGLAVEWAKHQIRFNVVLPTAGETDMVEKYLKPGGAANTAENRAPFIATIPLGRFCTPADIGNAMCFLASDEGNFITGHELAVDGGRLI